jgi:hypothetical protein
MSCKIVSLCFDFCGKPLGLSLWIDGITCDAPRRHGQAQHNPRAEKARNSGCDTETFLELMRSVLHDSNDQLVSQ